MTIPPEIPIDRWTLDQTAALLERLTLWLEHGSDPAAIASCAQALSLGETDDPTTIAHWAEWLHCQLRDRADNSLLDPIELN
jgi:hypothetical protein